MKWVFNRSFTKGAACGWPGFLSRNRPSFPCRQRPGAVPGSRGVPAHTRALGNTGSSVCNSGFWGNPLRARSLLSPRAGAQVAEAAPLWPQLCAGCTAMWWWHQHHQLFCNQLATAPGTEPPNVPPKINWFLGKEDNPAVSPQEHSLSAAGNSGVLWVLFVVGCLGFLSLLLVCN